MRLMAVVMLATIATADAPRPASPIYLRQRSAGVAASAAGPR